MVFLSFLFSPFGRISRPSWWTIQLINTAIILVIASVVLAPAIADPGAAVEGLLSGQSELPLMLNVVFLPPFWIGLCASIKRYHDRGKTGLWCLIVIIPFIGPVWQLIELGSLTGTKGANAFGEQPSGFGATGSSMQNVSAANDGAWSQNMDDAIANAVTNLATEQSHPSPKPSPVKKLNPNFANGGRTSFGQRGIS